MRDPAQPKSAGRKTHKALATFVTFAAKVFILQP